MHLKRRSLILIASAIVLIGVATGLYFLLFGGTAQLTVTDNPFGETGSDFEGTPPPDTGSGIEIAPRLIRITDRPVADGVVAFTRLLATTTTTLPQDTLLPQDSDTEVRFIDRASGNVYSYLARARNLTRISNKTLPGIQKASWLPDGSKAFVQFLSGTDSNERVATYVLPDSGEGGFFLEQDLAQANAVGSSSLFTLLSGTTGSVGQVSKSDGTGARTLFTSLLSSIAVHPTNAGYFANSKSSLYIDGYAFQINTASGKFTRFLGPLSGLSSLPSPDGKYLLYSFIDQGGVRLAVLDTATRAATSLPVVTLAEKCAWAPDSSAVYCGIPTSVPAGLPDSWYQGSATFTDRLWKIDMAERLATLLVDPRAVADVSIDAVSLTPDPDQDFLMFMDKVTGSLWAYEL